MARDTNTREIGRCFKFILKGLESAHGTIQNEMNQHALKPGDLLRRYCSTLALPNDVIRAIVHAVEKFLEMREVASYSHKSQNSVAAAGIYLVRTISPSSPRRLGRGLGGWEWLTHGEEAWAHADDVHARRGVQGGLEIHLAGECDAESLRVGGLRAAVARL